MVPAGPLHQGSPSIVLSSLSFCSFLYSGVYYSILKLFVSHIFVELGGGVDDALV